MKDGEGCCDEQARANAFTFGAMVEQLAKARKSDNRAAYLTEAVKCCTRNLPGWQERPARSITAAEATTQLHAIKAAKGATTANRTLSYARAAYSWASDNHKVTANPLKGIKCPGKEVPRERVMSEVEQRSIWQERALSVRSPGATSAS